MSKRYCQSCGMPLRFDMEEWLGTNLDGSKSDTFCYYCLKDGKYTVDVSMHEMIDIWLSYIKGQCKNLRGKFINCYLCPQIHSLWS